MRAGPWLSQDLSYSASTITMAMGVAEVVANSVANGVAKGVGKAHELPV